MNDKLLTYLDGKFLDIHKTEMDEFMKKLIDSEFCGNDMLASESTRQYIERLGFLWDPLSAPGYLTFKPYAAFMEEATKKHIWDMVWNFGQKNKFPIQRITGGDLYSLDKELMRRHVTLAEKVGMYGDGLLKVTGNKILRFSGCSNKLALLKQIDFDRKQLPIGIFEISDSYRNEKKEQLDYLVRNRFFHLPELHIVNENLNKGLKMLLLGHDQMVLDMKKHGLDFIMLFSTTKRFLEKHKDFVDELCKNAKHNPVINVTDDDSCENGIIFDVEYKAYMSNDSLVEIGTFQIDEGLTDFAYGITYQGKPVTTVHAVFFASSIERTIFTYCDRVANSKSFLPDWLLPVQYRVLPASIENTESAVDIGYKLLETFRTEVDDSLRNFDEKLYDAKSMKIPNILCVGDDLKLYNWELGVFETIDFGNIITSGLGSNTINQFSPLCLSEKVI